MTKEQEVMQFLQANVFDPILSSPLASQTLKTGVRYTIMRMNERDATGMVSYYWSAIVGTERSTEFARNMKKEKFTRFEECIDEFRDRFDDNWLRKRSADQL
jgi:predicted glycosyl hydrolase (DUF1957 family)